MRYSWLLFVSISVFSILSAAPVQKRGLLPTNINIDIKLGKQSTSKNADSSPAPGTHKHVLNAPFGLASLTISTTHQKKNSTEETGKPCNPDAENIVKDDIKKPNTEKDTLGGKGSALFGFGRPPPPPPQHGFFGPPPPPYHQPHQGCHHEPPPPPPYESTYNPPQYTSTKIPYSTLAERKPTVPSIQSTTEDVDNLIGDIFGGGSLPSSSTSTTNPQNIDLTDREQTGEGTIDVRMPSNK